jgi:hypothetical protein
MFVAIYVSNLPWWRWQLDYGREVEEIFRELGRRAFPPISGALGIEVEAAAGISKSLAARAARGAANLAAMAIKYAEGDWVGTGRTRAAFMLWQRLFKGQFASYG